jgi:hypothetical protein
MAAHARAVSGTAGARDKVTESVYRHQLRPVMTTGAEMMDALLRDAG